MDTIAYSSVTPQRSAQDLRDEALQMIQRMRKPEALSADVTAVANDDSQKPPAFSSTLSGFIQSVNTAEQTANTAQQDYEAGDGKESLTDSVLATQQASVEFQLLASIRNKAISAYKEIEDMNI